MKVGLRLDEAPHGLLFLDEIAKLRRPLTVQLRFPFLLLYRLHVTCAPCRDRLGKAGLCHFEATVTEGWW